MIHAHRDKPVTANLLRVYCVSGDKAGDRPLHEVIVEAARNAHLGGASVLVCKAGYSRGGFFFDEILSEVFIDHQPIVVEIVDLPDRLAAFLPTLHALVQGRRLITVATTAVIFYQTHPEEPSA